ncbi:MAG: RNA polymerase sigma-70 factor (ECF subfamily) [Candidatus Marinamargulisbacteria bacterium]|jgi:RNA polymerase sigma-70 factor (ECF subfamily)
MEQERSDFQLVDDFKSGQEQAFIMLLDRYEKKVYRMVFGMVRNTSDAQDLTQEIFVKVYQNLKKFRTESSLSNWILKIGSNHVKKFWIKSKVGRLVSLEFLADEKHWEIEDVSDDANLELTQEKKETFGILHKAIENLDMKARQIIVLRELNELSYQDIATILNMSIGTVKSRLSRAKEKLKEQLELSNQFSKGVTTHASY